jgi:vacuolar protein-sorting-associated protein 4
VEGVGKGSNNVLLLGATNVPWELDHAIRRRFDKCIYIPLPDHEARTYMLKLHMKDKPNDLTDDDFKMLGKVTEGASGSGIDCLVKDARLESIRKYQQAKQFMPIENGNYYIPCEIYPSCRFCLPKLSMDPPGTNYTCKICGAERMNLWDVPSEKLKSPHLTLKDFERALKKRSFTSVSAKELDRYVAWTEEFGEGGALEED